jgi:AP2 domain
MIAELGVRSIGKRSSELQLAARTESIYALKRLQHDSGVWYWQVAFSRKGQRHVRRFYDSAHGGNAGARRAAVAWRDRMLAQVQPLSVAEFCQHKRSNNTSGVPGVHFLRPGAQPEGIWQARLKLGDGTKLIKSFSVLKHGQHRAFELAIEARQQMLQSVAQRLYLHDPLAIELAPRPPDSPLP